MRKRVPKVARRGTLEMVSHVFTLSLSRSTHPRSTSTAHITCTTTTTTHAFQTNSPGSVFALKEPALDTADLLAGRLGALGELGVKVDDLGSPGRCGAGRLGCIVSFARSGEKRGRTTAPGVAILGGMRPARERRAAVGSMLSVDRGGVGGEEGECARISMAEGEDEAQVAYSRKSPRVAPPGQVWEMGGRKRLNGPV